MSDWAVGDLALCVDVGPIQGTMPPDRIDLGGIYRVAALFPHKIPGLVLDGFSDPVYAARFRKIRPDEHEGNADDWALIVETTKRKAPEPAERERRILEALFPDLAMPSARATHEPSLKSRPDGGCRYRRGAR